MFRQRGFLRKMWRTGAPSLYGWRTIVSGTPAELAAAILADAPTDGPAVIPLHAEVEGGPYGRVCDALLSAIAARGWTCRSLREVAEAILADPAPWPVTPVVARPWPGRAGVVIGPAPAGTP